MINLHDIPKEKPNFRLADLSIITNNFVQQMREAQRQVDRFGQQWQRFNTITTTANTFVGTYTLEYTVDGNIRVLPLRNGTT
jgi:hypothetical protein